MAQIFGRKRVVIVLAERDGQGDFGKFHQKIGENGVWFDFFCHILS
jgi:hypothetical protein